MQSAGNCHPRMWLLTFFSIILLPYILNIAVDPYGYFQVFEIKGFNRNKTDVLSEYATKFYYAKKFSPEAIMVGTSRLLTFHPDDLNKYLNLKVYNLALSGSNICEQYNYIKYFVEHYHVKHVILSLDFFSFNPDNENKTGYVQDRFVRRFYYKDFIDAVLPMDTLKSSLRTIRNNSINACYTIEYSKGYSTWCAKEHAYKENLKSLVVRDMKNTLKLFATDKAAYNSEKMKDYANIKQNIQYLRNIVSLCSDHNVILTLYVSPIHESQFDLIYAMQLGDVYEQWKSDIANIHEYYDFTGRNSVTTVRDLWWDSSHLKKEGGRLIFARLFGILSSDGDFGARVTKDNIQKHLLDLRLQVRHLKVKDILDLKSYNVIENDD